MHTSQRQCFDAHDPRFKCCCGSIHVKTGALVVAILMAIALGLNLISNVVYYNNNNNGSGGFGSSIAGALIGGVVCALLFYGIRLERAGFLMPYLILQGIGIVVLTIGAIICFVGAVSNAKFARDFADEWVYNNGDMNGRTVAIVAFISLLITVIIQVWFFWVVYKCYVFFRLQCAYIHSQSHTVCYSPQAPPGCTTVYVNTAPAPGYNTMQANTAPYPGYAPQQQYQTAYMSQPPPNYAP
uniref:DUF7027 domain-containing protein n=1 Tax=Plectus sambesii TaxID=2011161 RepID=A0A914X7L2_9BILA